MQAIVKLKNMRFYAFHGVLTQERKVGGEYLVSVQLTIENASRAVFGDVMEGTVNYAEVFDLVKEVMSCPVALLEHVAGRIMHRVFMKFPAVIAAQVEVGKVNPPMGAALEEASIVISSDRTHFCNDLNMYLADSN